MPPRFSLLTQVLLFHHIEILEDWLEVLKVAPKQLVVYTGEDPKLRAKLKSICDERDIRLLDLGAVDAGHYKTSEMAYLREQVLAVDETRICLLRLDTLPFRHEQDDWLIEALAMQIELGCVFITGTTNLFSTDRRVEDPRFALTQRLSNNFLFMQKVDWLEMIDANLPGTPDYGRFAVEGNIEHFCREKDLFGLRLINRLDFRFFHTQVWDLRLLDLRADFQAGRHVSKYLKRFQDEIRHPWDRYYQWPKDPLARRLRIVLGRWRRRLIQLPRDKKGRPQ